MRPHMRKHVKTCVRCQVGKRRKRKYGHVPPKITAIKYLGVYLEYGRFFHYSTFYEWLCLLLITHDHSKDLKLHEYAMTLNITIQTIYSQWKEIWILYKQYFILLIIYFQNCTSKNISLVSYSQYHTKGCLDTSQKLGSRFGVSTRVHISYK